MSLFSDGEMSGDPRREMTAYSKYHLSVEEGEVVLEDHAMAVIRDPT